MRECRPGSSPAGRVNIGLVLRELEFFPLLFSPLYHVETMARLLLLASISAALIAYGVHRYVHQCPDLEKLRGAVVIVTGASKGIGAELAVHYARFGSHLVLAARRRAELQATADIAAASGAASVTAIPTDMTDSAAVESLVAAAAAQHGRIDLLVLNHAIVDEGLFIAYRNASDLGAALADVLRTNLVGSAVAARAALPHLERSAGHIAVISSASAKVSAPFHAFYVASKSGLHGLFNTLRSELHLLGSRVTVGLQVLGMIGTPEVLRDPALAGMAAPVPAVAAEMVCASQARWDETFVPKWYNTWHAIT
jgi:short-subunit dehydrogenase